MKRLAGLALEALSAHSGSSQLWLQEQSLLFGESLATNQALRQVPQGD